MGEVPPRPHTSSRDHPGSLSGARGGNIVGSESGIVSRRRSLPAGCVPTAWSGFDAGLYDRMMFHYARALELATEAGDAYLQALVLKYAGAATVEHGQPNDGSKMLQYGDVTALDIPPDEQRAIVVGVERTSSSPQHRVRRWEGGNQVSRTQSAIVLATIHVRSGEPRRLLLAHGAVTSAARISSVRARRRLEPLAAALEARPGIDAKQLARMARQVATTRA